MVPTSGGGPSSTLSPPRSAPLPRPPPFPPSSTIFNIAAFTASFFSASNDSTWIEPSSSRLIFVTSCVSMSVCTVFPLGPITLPSHSGSILNSRMRGIVFFITRGLASTSFMSFKILSRPRCACINASLIISIVRPSDFISNWKVVMPVPLPATLKSIVPSASSKPRMSVRITGFSSAFSPRINPIATPATVDFKGTPASNMAIQQPHTVAILEEPQLSVINDSARTE
mmetsp:Transcript_31208/g.52185  ORF Transcript_31208/g.52185 Transcript_31208/m.52185 type:complete len:228 (-) Transcript_31208:88-771(-)